MPYLLGSARRIMYFSDAPDEISSLLCMVAAASCYGLTCVLQGGGLLYPQRSQFCVALCFLFSLLFKEVVRYLPRNYWWVLWLGAAPVVSLHRLDWKFLYCLFVGVLWELHYFNTSQVMNYILSLKEALIKNFWGDTFSLGSNALISQIFINLVLVSLKEEQYRCVHTQTLRKSHCLWYFSIFRHPAPLQCQHTVQTLHLILYRKLWMVMYVIALLFSSENWTKEKQHLKLIIESKTVSFLSKVSCKKEQPWLMIKWSTFFFLNF